MAEIIDAGFSRNEYPLALVQQMMRAVPTLEMSNDEQNACANFLGSFLTQFAESLRKQYEKAQEQRVGNSKYLDDRMWEMMTKLRNLDEGATVTICSSNPDPATPDEAELIICCGFWTGWADARFYARTVQDALEKAWAAFLEYRNLKNLLRKTEKPAKEIEVETIAGLPIIDDFFRGCLALALISRKIIDMPTARAIIDEAIDGYLKYKYGDIVKIKPTGQKFGRVVGYFRTLGDTAGVTVETELGALYYVRLIDLELPK